MKRLLTTLSIFILFLALPLLGSRTVFAACSWPTIGATSADFVSSTCVNTMSGSCAINTQTVEQYTCATTETGSTNSYRTVVGGHTLTITAGTTTELKVGRLTLTGAGSIAMGGSGAKITLDNGTNSVLWVADGDADGYSANFNTTYTATASGRRLRNLMRSTTADCNDAAYSTTNTCYAAFYPAFYPAFNPYGGFSPYGTFYPVFTP